MMNEGFVNTIAQNVTEAMFDKYDAAPAVLRGICEQDTTEKDGIVGLSYIGLDELVDTPDDQDVKLTKYEEGWKYYIRVLNMRRGYEITKNMLADLSEGELLARLRNTGASWGEKAREAEEKAVAAIFNKGPFAAGDLETFDGTHSGHDDPYPTVIYDNTPFFNAVHPLYKAAGTTRSNLSDSVAALTPNYANISTAWKLMTVTNAIDERAEPVSITPDTILLNPINELDIEQVLESAAQTDKDSGNINILKGRFNVVYSPYLTNHSNLAWFMGVRGKGVKFVDRSPAVVTVEKVVGKEVWLVSVKKRFGVGVTQWRYWSAWNAATS